MSGDLPWGRKEDDCPCEPEALQSCPECYERPYHDTDTCWRCDGRGLVPVYDDDLPIVYVHKPSDLRGRS